MSKESAKFAATMTMKDPMENFLMAREACIVGGILSEGLSREEAEEITDEAIENLYEKIKPDIKSHVDEFNELFKHVTPTQK